MSWQDLAEGVLGEFAERALYSFGLEEAHRDAWQRSYYERIRCLPDVRERELAARRQRRAVQRSHKMARRPCAHCGAPFERGGPTGTVPKYCAPRCMRAAIWARYSAKRRAS